MKNSKLTLIMLSIVAIVLSSCSHRILDLTLVSTKNVDLSKASTFEREKQRVEGVDKIHIVLLVPFGRRNLKEAIDKAMETTPGCIALVDGVIYTKGWWAIFYGQQSYIVEGTPLVDKSLAINSDDIPKYKKICIDKNGEIRSNESISSTTYLALKDKIMKKSKGERFEALTKLE